MNILKKHWPVLILLLTAGLVAYGLYKLGLTLSDLFKNPATVISNAIARAWNDLKAAVTSGGTGGLTGPQITVAPGVTVNRNTDGSSTLIAPDGSTLNVPNYQTWNFGNGDIQNPAYQPGVIQGFGN